jgi:E3 ubiquitin-protein ligase SIAH1
VKALADHGGDEWEADVDGDNSEVGHVESILSTGNSAANGVKRKREEPDKAASIQESLWGMLECPICLEIMCGSIFQCMNGHAVCESCQGVVQKNCPTCREPFPAKKNRNLALEQLAANVLVPCAHSAGGCKCKFECESSMDLHKGECPFRPMPCVRKNCEWKGPIHRLADHLVDQHAHSKNDSKQQNIITSSGRLQCSNKHWNWKKMIRCSDKCVLPHVKRESDGYFVCARKLATEEEAAQHNFHVVFKNDTSGAELSFTGSVHSAHQSVETLKMSGKGILVGANQMHDNFNDPLAGTNETLRMAFTWDVSRR